MKRLARSFLVFITTLQALASAQLATTGTWFQEMTSISENDHDIFNEYFHRCSLKEQCNFVVNDLNKNVFNEVSDEKDLPTDKNIYAIWKKMKKAFHYCKGTQQNGMNVWQRAFNISWGNGTSTFRASCDMTTDGGGWTVVQRRVDANVSFDRNWDEYVKGFGDPLGNHWLGLEAMHQLTMKGNFTLRFDLQNNNGSHGFAEYQNFKIADAQENYKISLGKYRGNVGDALQDIKGSAFSTKDKDNDMWNEGSCVLEITMGPWWLNGCFPSAILNNPYPQFPRNKNPYDGHHIENGQEMTWKGWNDITYSEMKIRRNN